MVNLAHFSDVHLSPLPRVRLTQLLSKRITGYMNWKLNRRQHMRHETLDRLVDHLRDQKPDFTVVTGDLVNLGLDAEFDNALEWIRKVGPADNVCAIPGNHDAYVRGARDAFGRTLGAYASGELVDAAAYPFVRRIGDAAIIGCSSAVATPPMFASGEFDVAQAGRLAKCLELLGKADYFRVVLIHHPPNSELAASLTKGLRGAAAFRDAVGKAGAELVLHGHTHRSSINEIDGPSAPVPVVGVAAASADARSGEDPARYNLFSIERTGTQWSCMLREYGYQRIGDEIVLRLQMRIH